MATIRIFSACLLLMSLLSPDTCRAADVTDCYTANGNDYAGNQSQVESPITNPTNFTSCVRWSDAEAFPEFQELPENYCRNPNDSVFPWCFVRMLNGQLSQQLCDIPTCTTPAYIGCFRATIQAAGSSGDTASRTVPLLTGEQRQDDPKMKIARCLNFCRSRSYVYAGLIAGHTCQCHEKEQPPPLDFHGAEAQVQAPEEVLVDANRLPASRCLENHCVGDPIHACGGSEAVSVYDTQAGSCKVTYRNVMHGTIYSPRWPGRYAHNLSCKWKVFPLPKYMNVTTHSVRFSFVYFDLGHEQDSLTFNRFRNFQDVTPRLYKSFNGSQTTPGPFSIPLDGVMYIFVIFSSDEEVARAGFTVSYKVEENGAQTAVSDTSKPALSSSTTTRTTTLLSSTPSSSATTQSTPSLAPSSSTQETELITTEMTAKTRPTKPTAGSQASTKPPVNVIVIGVACALVVLITVSVVVVIEMKRRRKKVPNDIKPPAEFKNPVTFNNGSKTVNIV